MTEFHRLIGERQRPGRVFVHHGVEHIEQQIATNQAKHRRHVFSADLLPRERDHLIEGALRVAHAALG